MPSAKRAAVATTTRTPTVSDMQWYLHRFAVAVEKLDYKEVCNALNEIKTDLGRQAVIETITGLIVEPSGPWAGTAFDTLAGSAPHTKRARGELNKAERRIFDMLLYELHVCGCTDLGTRLEDARDRARELTGTKFEDFSYAGLELVTNHLTRLGLEEHAQRMAQRMRRPAKHMLRGTDKSSVLDRATEPTRANA